MAPEPRRGISSPTIMGTQSIKRIYVFAIIAALLLHSKAASQEPHLKFEHFTVTQGLSSDNVYAILQDQRGFMWFGTSNGLNKYDGYGFTVYRGDMPDTNFHQFSNVSSLYEDKSGMLWLYGNKLVGFDKATGKVRNYYEIEPVRALYEDTAGTLWAATVGKGLNRFERTSGAFTRYNLSNDTLFCICEDSHEPGGILWIGGAGGVDRFDPAHGTFTHVEHRFGDGVTAIHKDRAGTLWIGTNEGLYTFDETTGTLWRCPVAGWRLTYSDCVHSFHEDRKGILWIGAGDELFSFDRSTGKFVQYPADRFFSRKSINPVYEDRRGSLWLKIRKGLSRFDPAGKRIVSYVHDSRDPSSLSDNAVNQIYEDRSGALWIATLWGGVNKLDKARKAFIHYAHSPAYPWSLTHNTVHGICEDRSGGLWIATRDGLERFDRRSGRFTHFRHDPRDPNSLNSNTVRAVVEDHEGTIWVGTESAGLDRLDLDAGSGDDKAKVRFRHYAHDPGNPLSIGSNNILSLFEDRSGKIWIGTADAGLDQFSKDTGIFVHYRSDPGDSNSLSCNWVNAVCEDSKGRLWVGTGFRETGALHLLDRITGKFIRFNEDQQPKGSVHSIYEDRGGTLWVGTTNDLNRFDPSTGTFSHSNVSQHIGGNFITGILEDASGCLWLTNSKGVSKFDPHTGKFRSYDKSDGVPINPTWGKACCMSRNGEMFFGGTNGFVRFHPDSIEDNSYVPPVVITAFKIFDNPVLLDTVISEKKLLQLSHRDNAISFEFVALNYTSPEKNQYAYKLEGFNEEWDYCGTRRYASYTNLDEGSYVFRVKGSNNDGVWNEEGTSIVLVITPPFWNTWWFKTVFLLTLAVSMYGTIRYIERQKVLQRLTAVEEQHGLERERLRISRDMHDEVGANLTKISVLSELAARKSEKTDGAAKELHTISQTAREVTNSIGAILWAINPQNDRLENLTGYVREYASGYFEMTTIDCRFNFPAEIPGHPLSAEVRRNIFLTLKEAINNVVKHSGATLVELHCRVSDHEVEFAVQDNGRGFPIEDLSQHGNGLLNMKRRIEDIHGDFHITSEPGSGTRIELTVPFK